MLYDVKLNREELFMTKKGLASVFTFYMAKKFGKILKWKSPSVKDGWRGGIY